MSVMRSTLLGGLVERARLQRESQGLIALECSRSAASIARDPLQPDGPLQVAGVDQPNRVAALAYGSNDDEQWAVPARDVDFFDIKGDLESLLPARTIRSRASIRRCIRAAARAIEIDDQRVGIIGQLAPAAAAAIRAAEGAGGFRDRS